MNPASRCPATLSARRRSVALAWVLLMLALALGGAGCEQRGDAVQLAEKGRTLWEAGRYQDAARNFITLSELYPDTALAEEGLFWAASLYHHYLQDYEQASRHYQHLTVTYPKGRYFFEAKLNLADVYEHDPQTRHRALQIYQQLLLAKELEPQHDWLRFKIARLNLEMGKMDQARLEFRDLLVAYPRSELRPEATYLIGYSYYLEKRFDLALFVFRQAVEDFPGTPVAMRAQYFVADTLEEQGKLRDALKAYGALKDKYPNPEIVEKRIKTLQARIRRGVR